MRRTLTQRAREAAIKLGLRDAHTLTDQELSHVLKRSKVADDLARVESWIPQGAPARCIDFTAHLRDKSGRVLAELDVFKLKRKTLLHGITCGTGIIGALDIGGATYQAGRVGSDCPVQLNTLTVCAGDRVLATFNGPQSDAQ